MSALGQKQTSAHVRLVSALPPKADMDQSGRDVRLAPQPDIIATQRFPVPHYSMIGVASCLRRVTLEVLDRFGLAGFKA
jgi:hypothetical protein